MCSAGLVIVSLMIIFRELECDVLHFQTFTVHHGGIAPTPTFGLATRDTHALRDYDAPGDKPLTTEFVHTPVRGKLDRPGNFLGLTFYQMTKFWT